MKNFIRNFIDTMKDDRFSFKFKICNIITNDWLRQNLAYARLHVIRAYEIINDRPEYFENTMPVLKHVERNVIRAKEHIDELWRV